MIDDFSVCSLKRLNTLILRVPAISQRCLKLGISAGVSVQESTQYILHWQYVKIIPTSYGSRAAQMFLE